MDRLIENGFAKKLINETNNCRIRNSLHFGVLNINKPGKVRLVFDAAATTANISLNKLLLAGPNFLNLLSRVLMRFRQFAVAIEADIRDMFLKIKINRIDRNAQ